MNNVQSASFLCGAPTGALSWKQGNTSSHLLGSRQNACTEPQPHRRTSQADMHTFLESHRLLSTTAVSIVWYPLLEHSIQGWRRLYMRQLSSTGIEMTAAGKSATAMQVTKMASKNMQKQLGYMYPTPGSFKAAAEACSLTGWRLFTPVAQQSMR